MMKKEQALKFYLSYKLYIFSAIVALSNLILITFVIFPQTGKLLSNQKAEQDISQKSKFLEAKAQALERYDPEDLNLKVKNTLNSYPVDKDLVAAVNLFQNFTAQSGFSIAALSIGGGSTKDGAQSYIIKLDILGPKDLLPSMLTSIENSTRLMRVSSIGTSVGRDPNSATISLTVDVLYSSAPGGFGSVESTLPELSQKDEEVLAKLAAVSSTTNVQPQTPGALPPRGKANPFE